MTDLARFVIICLNLVSSPTTMPDSSGCSPRRFSISSSDSPKDSCSAILATYVHNFIKTRIQEGWKEGELYLVNIRIQNGYKLQLPGVRCEFERYEKRVHHFMKAIWLKIQRLEKTIPRSPQKRHVPSGRSQIAHCPSDYYTIQTFDYEYK